MLRRFPFLALAIMCLSGCGSIRDSVHSAIDGLKASPDPNSLKSPADPDATYDSSTNTLSSPLGGYTVYFPEQPTQESLHRPIGAITSFCWTGRDLILEAISYPDSNDARKVDRHETTDHILLALRYRFEKQRYLSDNYCTPVVLNTHAGSLRGIEAESVTHNQRLKSCKFQIFIDTTRADAPHDVYLVATGTDTTLHSQYCRHFFDSLSFPPGLLKMPKATPAQ